jgi:hypothetical protein
MRSRSLARELPVGHVVRQHAHAVHVADDVVQRGLHAVETARFARDHQRSVYLDAVVALNDALVVGAQRSSGCGRKQLVVAPAVRHERRHAEHVLEALVHHHVAAIEALHRDQRLRVVDDRAQPLFVLAQAVLGLALHFQHVLQGKDGDDEESDRDERGTERTDQDPGVHEVSSSAHWERRACFP